MLKTKSEEKLKNQLNLLVTFEIYERGTLRNDNKKTLRKILLLKRWKAECTLVENFKLLFFKIFKKCFLKFSAPPLFHLNCWDLIAPIKKGISAGALIDSTYFILQPLNWALEPKSRSSVNVSLFQFHQGDPWKNLACLP